MEQFILVMLGVNFVLALVYAGCSIKKGNRIWLTLFFLALPIMGFLFRMGGEQKLRKVVQQGEADSKREDYAGPENTGC
mgnify:CR=1 FL=1